VGETMQELSYMIEMRRNSVLADYADAEQRNKEAYERGDVKASAEYIYRNQAEDAATITDMFYRKPIKVISVIKRTKVGMDGLMIELAKNMTTHHDDNFVLDPKNVLILTGMSNVLWEKDMKEKMPNCFVENVYHHGKLHRLKERFQDIKNACIIIDEIDNGDKVGQHLHVLLKPIWDMKYMEENNIRFVFVSATMVREIRDLRKWGEAHHIHYMTIPDSYIGHQDFLDMGIIQEYYPITTEDTAKKWIQEDILSRYGNDYRVHIIRSDERNKSCIIRACKQHGILYRNHASNDRISQEDLTKIFNKVENHIVLIIKGFYRRANLIPNDWKMKIGAVHERYTKRYDTSVQIQGLPGRMTGYWKDEIVGGHVTGPYRTSICAILEYEMFYSDPLGKFKYRTPRTVRLMTNPKIVGNFHKKTKKKEP
jgi:hypothetical protein